VASENVMSINECGVVGIITSKRTWSQFDEQAITASEGISFAQPSSVVLSLIDDLIKNGSLSTVIPKAKEFVKIESNDPGQSETNQQLNIDSVKNFLSSTYEFRSILEQNKNKYDSDKINKLLDILNRQVDFCKQLISKLEGGKKADNDDIFMWNSVIDLYLQAKILLNDLGFSSTAAEKNTTNSSSFTVQKYHYSCKDMMCQYVVGEGNNECVISSDCYRYTCKDRSCERVEGKGSDDCFSSYDCKHSECQSGKCTEVSGKGENQCYSDYYCKHSECQGGKCVELYTPGTTTCYSDWSCQQ
jgi:hypothetical protein